MSKLGLALSGGGALGSYEIGVWKALIEYGVDKRITSISGTSVGILNACLIIQNDYNKAYHIWVNEIENTILSKHNFKRKFKNISYNGIFSREGLLNLIEKYVDISTVSNYSHSIYAAAVNLSKLDIEYFRLNGRKIEDIIEIMMASSAVPFIFGREKIGKTNYIDGGVEILNGKNLPLKPLYDEGCDQIIAINLYQHSKVDKHPNCKVYEIIPTHNIGTFTNGGMDFSSKSAVMRIEEGYKDAINILKPIFIMSKIQNDTLKANYKMYKNELENSYNKNIRKEKLNNAIKNIKLEE